VTPSTSTTATSERTGAAGEIARGERFAFGRNWRRFLSTVDDARVAEAERSVREMLGKSSLEGLRFLDVGCGSGLFSLAARRLGAVVHAFDYDPESVECARALRRRMRPEDAGWTIEQGSALDAEYLRSLGSFDVVYAWGVLHHTGDMWRAIDLVAAAVAPGGTLFLSIYNDQGRTSHRWRAVKRAYCSGPVQRVFLTCAFVAYWAFRGLVSDVRHLRHPLARYRGYKRSRGMSLLHDWFDWLGGYPFEVAKPEEIFGFLRSRGFILERMTTCGGELGCNQFVLSAADARAWPPSRDR
jgi:2-polyprenyl-6-hydroxyphenyl methylase/3-demethylubiquinone-9 3-methyltransferase